MGRFLSAAANRMPAAEPAHVARLMYSLALLSFRPPAWWIARVMQQTMVQVGAACYTYTCKLYACISVQVV